MVGGGDGGLIFVHIGGLELILGLAHDLPQFRNFHGGLGDDGQIPGGSVVVFVMETAGVCKVGVLASQLLSLLIHQLGKSAVGRTDVFGQSIGGVVARGDEKIVEHIHKLHLLSCFEKDAAALFRQTVHRLLGHRDHIAGEQCSQATRAVISLVVLAG